MIFVSIAAGPSSVRRKARAEFELTIGKKFNPRKHKFDHYVPFSRGGSHGGQHPRGGDEAEPLERR
jgi:hypothetical protein